MVKGGGKDHDNGYKMLFSHAEMVEGLLRGFVREDWVDQIDFSTLQCRSASAVADTLESRHDDIVWRVRLREQWLYVFIIIEFQSGIDRYMAVRLMTYVGLLYQNLIRSREVRRGGLLPPVVPIVLYNGLRRWRAPTEVGDLIKAGPSGLAGFVPRLRFALIDEGAYAADDLEIRNFVAKLFALERSRSIEEVRVVLRCLIELLQKPSLRYLRRSFTIWIGRVFLPSRIKGVAIPEFRELQEVEVMLGKNTICFSDQWKEEGKKIGEKIGKKIGKKIGERIGEKTGQMKLIATMLKRGGTVEEIARLTGIDQADIERLAASEEKASAPKRRRGGKVSEEPAPYEAKAGSDNIIAEKAGNKVGKKTAKKSGS